MKFSMTGQEIVTFKYR